MEKTKIFINQRKMKSFQFNIVMDRKIEMKFYEFHL